MTLTRQLLRNDVLATLKSNIADGVWHTSLPSERQLADQFQISRGTLRYALRILQEEGIIQSIPGSGYVIKKRIPKAKHHTETLFQGRLITQSTMRISKVKQTWKNGGLALGTLVKSIDPVHTEVLSQMGISCLTVILLSGLGFVDTLAAQASPQNVLMISVDDMRDWTNFLGGYEGEVFTPHMDKLAKRGINFTNAHCPSPVCNPSRTAVMTGLMPSTTGIYNNSQWLRANYPETMTMPRFFKEQGYRVIGTGKSFHHTAGNNPPDQWHAYKRIPWADFPWTRSNKLNYPWTEWMPPPEGYPFSKVEYLRGRDERDWGILPRDEAVYDDAVVVDYAIDFLKNHPEDLPFFLSVGTFHPHLPWYIPKRYHDLYADKEVHLPEAPQDDLEDVPEIGKRWAAHRRDEMQAAIDAGRWGEAVRCYLASISFADAQVGRIMEALDRSAFAGNTIVVLWSDHGFHLGEKDHWMKSTLWEEATRVPFIIVTPDMKITGAETNQPVNLISIFPTLVSLLNLESDVDFDGPNLSPLLENPKASWPHPSIIDYEYGNTAVRDQRWRYIRYKDATEELYDHQNDPNEWKNLASDPAYQKIKERLSSHLPATYTRNVPGKSAFIFNPDNWTFTNKKTGQIIHGAN